MPRSNTRQISVWMSQEDYEQLVKLAEDEDRSPGVQVRHIVRQYLAHRRGK